MAAHTCIPSLQNVLDVLSQTQPTPMSTTTPYLAVSRPSARYNHVNEYKTLLASFGDARDLLNRIVEAVRDFEVKLETQEKGVRNALAPVHALPAECVREIFLCLAEETTYCDKGRALSQVCSFWRSVSLTTPEVWTHARDLDTALMMTRVNREKKHKFPLRFTLSAGSSYLEIMQTSEGRQALDDVCSLRIAVPIGEPLTCRPPPKIQELILCGVASDMWRSDAIDDTASLIVSCQGRTFTSVQLYGCTIKTKGLPLQVPEEIIVSRVPIPAATRAFFSLLSEVTPPRRLHLHQIGSGRGTSRDTAIRSFVDAVGLRENTPASFVLDECLPELCNGCLHDLTRGALVSGLKDFQISVPNLRLEPQDIVGKLRNYVVVLPRLLKATSISVSAPSHWIFDLLEKVISDRSERHSSGRKLSPLQLRMTVPGWCLSEVNLVVLRSRWASIAALIPASSEADTLRISLTISNALVTGFEDIASKCCTSLTRLPEGDEYAIDYEYAKYPREHYGFTS